MTSQDFSQLVHEKTAEARALRAKINEIINQINNTKGRIRARLEPDLVATIARLEKMAIEFSSGLTADQIRDVMKLSVEAVIGNIPEFHGQIIRVFPHIFSCVPPRTAGLPLFRLKGEIPESFPRDKLTDFKDEAIVFRSQGPQLTVEGSADTLIRWVASVVQDFYEADALSHLDNIVESLEG